MSSAPRSHPRLPAVHGSVTFGPLRGLFPSEQLASLKEAGVSLLHAYGNLMMDALQCSLMMEVASLYFAVFCWLGASPRSEPMQGCNSLEVTFRFLAAHTLTCVGFIACTVILWTHTRSLVFFSHLSSFPIFLSGSSESSGLQRGRQREICRERNKDGAMEVEGGVVVGDLEGR